MIAYFLGHSVKQALEILCRWRYWWWYE